MKGKAPMTKEAVGVVVMGKLPLKEDHVFVDMGAGTGSISIEVALKLPFGEVYAIEYKEEALKFLELNIDVFDLDNIKEIKGRGKTELKKINTFDRIFIDFKP